MRTTITGALLLLIGFIAANAGQGMRVGDPNRGTVITVAGALIFAGLVALVVGAFLWVRGSRKRA